MGVAASRFDDVFAMASNDGDLGDAGVAEGVDLVFDDGFVVEFKQGFWAVFGEWVEASAFAGGEQNCFIGWQFSISAVWIKVFVLSKFYNYFYKEKKARANRRIFFRRRSPGIFG
jgi:hypothetical protein